MNLTVNKLIRERLYRRIALGAANHNQTATADHCQPSVLQAGQPGFV